MRKTVSILLILFAFRLNAQTAGNGENPTESIEAIAVEIQVAEDVPTDRIEPDCKPTSPIKNPYRFKGTELIAPGVLLTAGVIGLESNWARRINREIKDGLQGNGHGAIRIDNVTPFIPIAATYGLNLCGVKGKHSMMDVTIIYGTTYLLLAATLFPMKDFIKSERPNRKNFNSFPSGHTAIAFAAAEVLRREYWDVSPWIGVGGYLFAAGTGFLRMYNDAHWLTDVLGGAGLGILCAEAAYWLYPAITKTFFRKQYDTNIFLAPQVSTRQIGMSCALTF